MAGLDDLLNGIWGTVTDSLPGGTGTSGGSVIPTTPATTTPGTYAPLGEYPSPDLIAGLSGTQLNAIKDGLSRTKFAWETKKNAATGSGGNANLPPDSGFIAGKYYWNGEELSGLGEYSTKESSWLAANGGGSGSKKSPDLLLAERALGDIAAYEDVIDRALKGVPAAEKDKAPVKIGVDQFLAATGSGGAGGAYDLDQFLGSVLTGLGMEPTPWRMNLMREWAKGEGTGAGFNPLATTQAGGEDPSNPHWNSNGGNPVKNYKDFQTGVAQTVKTMTNGYYPLILQTLANEQVVPGSGAQARTWGTMHLASVLDSGVIPDSSGYKGANPGTGSRYDKATVQKLFDQYGNWADVAGALYDMNPDPAVPRDAFIATTLTNLGNFAKSISEGSSTPSGYSITGTPSSGSGSGSNAATDPLYWEKARGGESDRRYDNWSQRQKDYMTAAGADNDLLKDLASILGNKVSAEKANQDIQDSAIETAMGVNAAVKAGKADYYDSMGGGIWGNSLGGIIKELDNIYNQMNRPVPGMTDTMLSTIPRYAPQDYYMDIPGLPDEPTEFFTPNRYATGTVDWHDEPYIAIAQSGGNIPTAVRKRLEAAGALGPSATPTTPTTGGAPPVATPTVTGGYPGAGYVPRNSTLPTPERVYDTNEWLDQAVSSMARNISAGNSGLPTEWGVTGLEAWHGVPPSQMDASFLTRLRSIILAHKSDPAIVQAFGADPGIATEYVRDPNAPAPPKTTASGGGGGMMNGYGSSQTMSGTYGGGMDPTDAARIGLEKESLDLQREIQRAQMELERQKFELAKIQDTRSAEYMEKEYQLRVTEQALAAQRFELEKTNADLQKTIFEDNVRRWEIETGMSRERLDLDKIAQEAELDFKRQQLDIQRDAGILDQKKYEESVRQFNETFGYQKAQDDRKFRLERAKTVAEFMADPNDPMARNFFYANMEDPKGLAFDMFTGENMGESTYGETYKKNAEMWEESTQPVNQFSSGSMYSHGSPYVRDSLFITGDHVSGRATGNEEAIYNPTGAPVAIFSNEMTRALGLAPKKGKNFRGAA